MALQIDDERLAMRIELVRRGMTQRRLADAVGIDARALSDYLLGRRNLPAEVRSAILTALAGGPALQEAKTAAAAGNAGD